MSAGVDVLAAWVERTGRRAIEPEPAATEPDLVTDQGGQVIDQAVEPLMGLARHGHTEALA